MKDLIEATPVVSRRYAIETGGFILSRIILYRSNQERIEKRKRELGELAEKFVWFVAGFSLAYLFFA